MFFYSNNTVSIDQPSFWETSYLLRQSKQKKSRSVGGLNPSVTESTVQLKKDMTDQESVLISNYGRGRDHSDMDILVCPVFLKDLARAIISAGKSLQLIQHVQDDYVGLFDKRDSGQFYDSANHHLKAEIGSDKLSYAKYEDGSATPNYSDGESFSHSHKVNHAREMGVLTLPEVFLLSLVGLVGDGDHIYEYFQMSALEHVQVSNACMDKQKMIKDVVDSIQPSPAHNKTWFKLLTDVISERRIADCSSNIEDGEDSVKRQNLMRQANNVPRTDSSFCPINPVISVCREFLQSNKAYWNELNISRNFHLPPLNDEILRKAIFGETPIIDSNIPDVSRRATPPRLDGTDYTFGFQFDEVKHLHLKSDTKILESLYPFPTILPCFQVR